VEVYKWIVEQEKNRNVLIVAHEVNFVPLWKYLFNEDRGVTVKKLEFVKLPVHQITNELDKRILATLHELGNELEKQMNGYVIDGWAKAVLGFVDKLNNRYIRRSRRRFRASGMDSDKQSAYQTLFEVLESYVKYCAPFAPFVSEHIYLQLQKMKWTADEKNESVHLTMLPLPCSQYLDETLLSEIATVRRIISLGLFIRSKNKIATKQPLSQLQIRL